MIARGLETAIEDAIPYQPDPLAERLAALVACRAALEGCRETVHEPLVRRVLE